MGPRCSSAETQVCHRSYIIAAKVMRENNFILFPQYNILFPQLIILFPQERYKAKGSNTGKRGQDGKISEKSQTPKGKDFPRVSEIFASCPPTGVRFFFSLKTPNRFVYIPSSVFPAIFFFHCWSKYSIYPYASVSWQYF